MHTYTVTVGRNVPEGEHNDAHAMSDYRWGSFQGAVLALLVSIEGSDGTVEWHRGTVTWEGIREDSAKLALLRHSPLLELRLSFLRRNLATLAKEYDQEAVALTIGESELIHG